MTIVIQLSFSEGITKSLISCLFPLHVIDHSHRILFLFSIKKCVKLVTRTQSFSQSSIKFVEADQGHFEKVTHLCRDESVLNV